MSCFIKHGNRRIIIELPLFGRFLQLNDKSDHKSKGHLAAEKTNTNNQRDTI